MPIFLSDSLFMLPLLLCSVVAVAVIVHRMVSLRATNVLPQALTTALRDADAETIRNQVEDDRSSLGRVCQQALTKQHPNRAAATSSAETYAREEISKLQAGLTTLEVIITIAPLLGLLGTVSGLVTVFSGLGASGNQAPSGSGIARGIAEALNTTIAGLVVAVPAVIAHGFFQRKIERLTTRMERVLHEAIERFYH
ncbi:MAG: MotA/TolQ/ExbB proton channel family protein [Verrucomicrobiales bacterium]|jgi:biopolymer transport protein ExbB|nr:MotA/TolQ/ExbB proton channel family protein [Verrucomicrobiales bacterium]